MPLPAGLQLYITSADGTQRRRLPRAQVESVTTAKERFGGFGQCTVATAIPYSQAPALTIQIGDRVETWFQGQRRYRGYVSALAPSGEEPRKVLITAFGVSALLRKQFCDRSYAFPSGGVDVSAAFAALAQDFLLHATGPGGFRLIQSVQSLPVGTALQALDARRKLAGDVLDALVKEAGNLAVWGVDVDSAGLNRLFFRPLSPASPPVHAVPVPGKIVESASGERQAADIVNQLTITGGAATYPNLLHNGGFELPVQQEDGAGNLVVNGSFDLGSSASNCTAWALNSGAAANTPFSFPPKQAAAYTGNRFLQMEGAGQNAVQVTNAALTAGHNYCLSVRAAKEMDQQIATGHALLQVYSGAGGAGTLLLSQTVALTPSGQGYDYFSGTFPAPPGSASFRLTVACDTNDSSQVAHNDGYSGGLLADDVQLYDVSVVYQDGWYVDVVDQLACRVNAVNWVYQDAAFEGGYCVYLDATATDADGHDLKLQPLAGNQFKVTAAQSLRAGVWLKSPPASVNPQPPKFNLEFRLYDSSGNLTHTPRQTFAPGFLAAWTYFELVCFATAGDVAADANLTWRSAGSLLVDAFSVRDAQAPPMASGNGSTAPLAPYLPDGPLCYFLKASDPYLNGTWRPANGYLAAAPYAGSEALYGPRCGALSDTSILLLDDACAVANATFTAQAAPLSRPSVTVVNDPRIYWPGETVNLIGADGPALQGGMNGQNGAALPIARVTDTWDGLLKTRLDMETEQPDVSLAIKRIVQDELRRLGPSGGGGSTGSGGYSGGYSGGATSPAYRLALQASASDPTLHDAYTGIPHASAASQAGWTGTTAEVVAARTRTVKGASSTSLEGRLDAMEQDIASASTGGGSGAAPATASAFGTVETDITESGGSVVYTKTTLDTLLAGKISVGAALPESEITGLLTDLSNKITVGAALSESEITNLVSDLGGKIAAGTALPESEITNLVSDLAGKIAASAALPESEITNLAADLAARITVAGTPADGQVPTWVASAGQYQPKTPAAGSAGGATPIATSSTVGTVRPGTGLSIDGSGTLTVNNSGAGNVFVTPGSGYQQLLQVAPAYQSPPGAGFSPAPLLTDNNSGDTSSGYKGGGQGTGVIGSKTTTNTISLAARWLLNASSGTTEPDSVSSPANDLAVTGAVTFGSDATGGSFLKLNANGQYAACPNTSLYPSAGDFSVEMCFYDDATTTGNSYLCYLGVVGQADVFFAYATSSGITFLLNTSQQNVLTDPTPRTAGLVYYIASLSSATNTWTLYRNGTQVASLAVGTSRRSVSGSSFYLGGRPSDVIAPFKYYFCGFFNKGIGASEALARYQVAVLQTSVITALLDVGAQGVKPISQVSLTRSWLNSLAEVLEYSADGLAWTAIPTGYTPGSHGGTQSSVTTTVALPTAITPRYLRYSGKDSGGSNNQVLLTDYRVS